MLALVIWQLEAEQAAGLQPLLLFSDWYLAKIHADKGTRLQLMSLSRMAQ